MIDKFTTPPYLKPGDTIAIISTARKIHQEDIEASISLFNSWGLKVKTGRNLFEQYYQFAGTDEQRAADLQLAMDDPEIKAIICARGGYGTTRIIDKINFDGFVANPKWIAGFSDVTALLCHLQQYNIESIHSIMPILFQNTGSNNSINSLKNALFGKDNNYVIPFHDLNRAGTAQGVLAGGNLSIIHNLIGTSSDLKTDGKILFLEDLDEYLYHIDRMMGHLKRAGKLINLAGLIIGHFSNMKDNSVPFGFSAYEIIKEIVKEYNYPVCFGFPVGHEFDNMAMICGREITLSINYQMPVSLNII